MREDTRDLMLKFIMRYKMRHDGNSPTYQEIMGEIGLSSTSTVSYHLDRLENEGLIRRPASTGNSRVIEIVGGKWTAPKDYHREKLEG
jgi:repressor LexA